jgi:hypothetical protein
VVVRFTKESLNLAPPADRHDVILWETGTGLGLRLRVAKDGTINRSWICQYRHAGHTRRMSEPASTFNPEEARAWARKLLGRVANNADPQLEKKAAAKPKLTFRTVVDTYLRFA